MTKKQLSLKSKI